MTQDTLSAFVADLSRRASEAGAAEQRHQKEAARRAAELKEERAFAYRRLNLVRVVAAQAGGEDEEQAYSDARRAFLQQIGWNGATQNQKEVAERFRPVIEAIRAELLAEDENAEASVAAELAAFEAWYEETRGAPFLTLMEREIVQLPLVEV